MECLQKHLKILAGVALLLLTLAWVVWPQGDLPKAVRLMEKGNYEQAVLLLNQIALERPGDRDIQLLRARALIGAGRLNDAERALKFLSGPGGEPFKEIQTVWADYATKQGEREEWAKAVEGWWWVYQVKTRDASHEYWEPPVELQTPLAMCVMAELSETSRKSFIRAFLDPNLPLSRLALVSLQFQELSVTDIFSLQAYLTELKELAEVDWGPYGDNVARLAASFTVAAEADIHLKLITAGAVQPGEKLSPEAQDYLLAQSWQQLKAALSARGGDFQETYAEFILFYAEIFPPGDNLNPVARFWVAAVTGDLETPSVGLTYLSETVEDSLLLTAGQRLYFDDTVTDISWSADQGFCGLETQHSLGHIPP